MNISPDLPIRLNEEDSLNRKEFCSNVTNYILSPSSNSGLVLSINGKWGSGKTSITNLIKENINKREYDKGAKVLPVVIDYTPWNVSDDNQIILQFLNTLQENLRYKKVLKAITGLLKITCRFAFDIFSSKLPFNIKKVVKDVDKYFSNYATALNDNSGNIEELKKKVVSCLKNSTVRYVVFIDDLDRLNNREIRLLMQLIKSTCNFPNITFVLLYDKNIIMDALSGEQGKVNGQEYLEKLVQIEFNVPEIRHDKLISFLENDLRLSLGESLSDKSVHRLQNCYSFGLFSQISTVRSEKRFINNLRFVIDCFAGEIDCVDLIIITYIRLIDENAYRLILNYEGWLLGFYIYDEKQEPIRAEFFSELFKTKLNPKTQKYLISELFPNMFSHFNKKNDTNYLSGRLCNSNIFHKYLNMDLDYEDMSLKEVKNVLNSSDELSLSDFFKNLNSEQSKKMLSLLDTYAKELTDIKSFRRILTFLFDNFSSLKRSSYFFEFPKNYYIGSVCNSLIHNVNIADAEKLLIEIVNNCYDISAMVWLCKYFIYKKEDISFDFNLVSEKTVIEIINITAKKVMVVINEDINASFFDWCSIIHFILANKGNDIKKLIKTKNNEWLCVFLAKSAFVTESYGSGGYNFYYRYDLELLHKVVDFKKINVLSLVEVTKNDVFKQRLIALAMQLSGVEISRAKKEEGGFSISDIRIFCENNKIKFKSSEDYETSIVNQ